MKLQKSSSNTPLEVYHGVPAGWSSSEVVATYYALGGEGQFAPAMATEPGAPSYLPDRTNWLQYRSALVEIAEGLKAQDAVCVELAIRFIELNYFGSYSGFLRERFARLLKNSVMDMHQAKRLQRHIQSLRTSQQMFDEFKEYVKLEKRIQERWPKL